MVARDHPPVVALRWARAPDGDHEVVVTTGGITGMPALDDVDRVARLCLALKRLGYSVRVDCVDDELVRLIDFVGLSEALLSVERHWEAENGEEPRNV